MIINKSMKMYSAILKEEEDWGEETKRLKIRRFKKKK